MKHLFSRAASLCFSLLLLPLLQGCPPKCKDGVGDNCPKIPNQEELITTVSLTMKDSVTGVTQTFTYRDIDGEGGNVPSRFDTIRLETNHTYFTTIQLWDETQSPQVDIAQVVKNEGNDHQFFFYFHNVHIAHVYRDFDTHSPPLPIGLETTWKTSIPANGYSHIVLKHQAGEKNGTDVLGSSDIDLQFFTLVQ
jgi:hypothetical protein